MADDLTTDNINKLLDLTTRIDERIIAIHTKQHEFDERLIDIVKDHNEAMRRIVILESKHQGCPIHNMGGQLDEIHKSLDEMDKRVVLVEDSTNRTQDRWKAVLTFVIQLVWVLLASWLLVKLNLQAPAVP
jgi:hypothetical protein